MLIHYKFEGEKNRFTGVSKLKSSMFAMIEILLVYDLELTPINIVKATSTTLKIGCIKFQIKNPRRTLIGEFFSSFES